MHKICLLTGIQLWYTCVAKMRDSFIFTRSVAKRHWSLIQSLSSLSLIMWEGALLPFRNITVQSVLMSKKVKMGEGQMQMRTCEIIDPVAGPFLFVVKFDPEGSRCPGEQRVEPDWYLTPKGEKERDTHTSLFGKSVLRSHGASLQPHSKRPR